MAKYITLYMGVFQMNKRQEVKSKRRQAEKRQRLITIIIIIAGALLVVGMIVYPNLQPVGNITVPPANNRPMVNENTLGDPNAPVKVEEYADFQCPACASWSQNIEKQFDQKYIQSGRVQFIFHVFSFIDDRSNTQESKDAAAAAYCAMDQGKFWEYHDMLFANQTGENVGDFTPRRLAAFADKLGLNMSQFNSCYSSGKYTQRVLDEKAAAEKLGISSTPSFVVDGKLVPLTKYSDVDAAIDAELAAKPN
jgi:protein-disulfide isomerase